MGANLQESRDLATAQAQLNRFNQVTPTGSATWSGPLDKHGRVDPFNATLTTSLSPEQQALLEQQQQAQQLLGGQVVNQLQGGFPGGRRRVEDAVYNRALRLLQPQLDQYQRRMDQQLANQGLPIGGEAVSAERTRFEDARSRQLQELAMSAVLAGGQEQSRQIGNILSMYNTAQGVQQPNVLAPPATPVQSFATQPGPGAGAGIGTAAGTLLGGGLGFALGGPGGALLGAGIGGGAGGAFGSLFG